MRCDVLRLPHEPAQHGRLQRQPPSDAPTSPSGNGSVCVLLGTPRGEVGVRGCPRAIHARARHGAHGGVCDRSILGRAPRVCKLPSQAPRDRPDSRTRATRSPAWSDAGAARGRTRLHGAELRETRYHRTSKPLDYLPGGSRSTLKCPPSWRTPSLGRRAGTRSMTGGKPGRRPPPEPCGSIRRGFRYF